MVLHLSDELDREIDVELLPTRRALRHGPSLLVSSHFGKAAVAGRAHLLGAWSKHKELRDGPRRFVHGRVFQCLLSGTRRAVDLAGSEVACGQPTNELICVMSLFSISKFHAPSATSTTRNSAEIAKVSTAATPRSWSHLPFFAWITNP